jgi:hypothetical protein
MAEPDLRFIGERLAIVQAELRDKANKSDVSRLSADIAALRADMYSHFASVDAQFAQVHETMASNFAVLLTAIKRE